MHGVIYEIDFEKTGNFCKKKSRSINLFQSANICMISHFQNANLYVLLSMFKLAQTNAA